MLQTAIFGALIGAVSFRIRGGLITDRWPSFPGQAQRLAYGAALATVMLAAGWPWSGPWWHAAALWAALVIAWFAGAALFPTFGSIDAGRRNGTRAADFWRNSLRGVLYALPPAALLAAFRAAHGDPDGTAWATLLPAAGALQGLAYEAAWRLRPIRRGGRPTELAELLTGAVLGVGAALACVP